MLVKILKLFPSVSAAQLGDLQEIALLMILDKSSDVLTALWGSLPMIFSEILRLQQQIRPISSSSLHGLTAPTSVWNILIIITNHLNIHPGFIIRVFAESERSWHDHVTGLAPSRGLSGTSLKAEPMVLLRPDLPKDFPESHFCTAWKCLSITLASSSLNSSLLSAGVCCASISNQDFLHASSRQ